MVAAEDVIYFQDEYWNHDVPDGPQDVELNLI